MPHAVLGPVVASVAGGLANKLFGGHGKTEAQLPQDMQGMRQNNISLLNYLTGFGPAPVAYGGPTPAMPHNDLIGQLHWIQQYGKNANVHGAPGTGVPQYGAPMPYQQHLAGGGMVQGPGGPQADQVPIMASNGEGVLNAAAVHALGGPDAVHAINQLGIMHLLMQGHGMGGQSQPQGHGMPHMALGGMVPPPPMPQGITDQLKWMQQYGSQARPQGATPAPAPAGPTMDPGRVATPPTVPGAATAPTAAPGGQNYDPAKSAAQGRFESVYGPLGTPVTDLQKQAVGGMSQYLASDPLKQAQSSLNQILGSPGDAFRPDYERALAQAKQGGGRFGSANALLDSQALSNYNAQALQQAIAAAGTQGQLSGQNVANYGNAYNTGAQLAGQLNSGNQQTQQLLNQALQTSQAATFGAPTQQQPSAFGQFAQGAGSIAQLLPYLYQQQQQGGGAPGYTNTNWIYQQ